MFLETLNETRLQCSNTSQMRWQTHSSPTFVSSALSSSALSSSALSSSERASCRPALRLLGFLRTWRCAVLVFMSGKSTGIASSSSCSSAAESSSELAL